MFPLENRDNNVKDRIRRCKKCILPETCLHIKFDKTGVCNFCKTYEIIKPKLYDFNTLAALLRQRFDRIRGRYKYDCLVGLSGGKDSAYVAYMLRKKYNLNVLSFTYDNGFLTPPAKNNIKKIVSKLGVDHFFYEPDWEQLYHAYRRAVMKHAGPCVLCTHLMHFIGIKFAFEKSIPFIVNGYSRSQFLETFSSYGITENFMHFLKTNYTPYNVTAVKNNTISALKETRTLFGRLITDSSVRRFINLEFFPDPSYYQEGEFFPEVLSYFVYEDYDETKIRDTVKKGIDWNELTTHEDCAIHDAATYLTHQILSWSLIEHETSVLIREGKLTRKEGLKIVAQKKELFTVPEESMSILLKKCGIPRKELPSIIRSSRKNYKLVRLYLKLQDFFKTEGLDL